MGLRQAPGSILPPRMLADLRRKAQMAMPEVVTRTRLQSGVWQQVGTTIGGVLADGESHFPWLPPMQTLTRWQIRVPADQAVLVGDRLLIAGMGTYAVTEVGTPQSYSLFLSVYGTLLYGTDGSAPLYFTPNMPGGITLSRFVEDAGTKRSALQQVATGVLVFIDDVGVRLKLQGIAPEFDLSLVCDGSVDIRDGDRVTGYVAGSSQRTQVLQVQHVDHNQAVGWDYKLAAVTVKE